MFRGNLPSQYNGSGMPTGQDYNPSYAGRGMPLPGQPGQPRMQVAGQPTSAVPGAQMSDMHRFQNAGYPGGSQGYPGGQPGAYGNDPYGYPQSKMIGIGAGNSAYQPLPSSMSTGVPSSHIYPSSGANQPRGYLPGGTGDLSTSDSISAQQYRFQQATAASHNWPGGKPSGEMLQVYGSSDTIGTMYNGSQFMSGPGMSGGQSGEQSTGLQAHNRLSLTGQPSSNYPGAETAPPGGGMPSYQQQRSAGAQYQMRPGMNTAPPTTPGPTSMYMPQYPGQTPQRVPGVPHTSMYSSLQRPSTTQIMSGQKHPGGTAGQYDDSGVQLSMQQQQAMQQQQQMQQQGQPTMQGGAPGVQYRPKMGPSSAHTHPNQSSQMMGAPTHPLQQAMSPRQGSPLSPMRNTSRQGTNLPPVSPQMPSSRTTPHQYPAPQASPHIHPQGPMSPIGGRLPSYSPKQTMNQQYANAGPVTPNFRPNVTPSKTPTPHADQGMRGFKSPTHMMSPPPPSNQGPTPVSHPQMPRMHASYNGDVSMQQQQQQHGYYGPTGRYPHGTWQGPRHPGPRMPTSQSQQSPMRMPRQMMPGQPQQQRYSQPHQVYNTAGPQPPPTSVNATSQSQYGFQQVLVSPPPNQAHIERTNSVTNGTLPVPSTIAPPSQPGPAQNSEFDNDFNLESILGDPLDTSGSFMQQLQEVAPSEPPANTEAKPLDIPEPTPATATQQVIPEPKLPVVENPPIEPATLDSAPQPPNQAETAISEPDQQADSEAAVSDNPPTDNASVATSETNEPVEKEAPLSENQSENTVAVEPPPQTAEQEAAPGITAIGSTAPLNATEPIPNNQHNMEQAATSLSPVKQQTTPSFSGPEPVPISSPTAEPKTSNLHQNAIFPPQTVTFPPAPTSAAPPFPQSPQVQGAYRPGMAPTTSTGHPVRPMQVHPSDPSYSSHSNQFRPVHSHSVQGMPPRLPHSGAPPGVPTSMHPHENPMVRGPHYPGLHPQHQYPPHHPHQPPHGPHPYGYGPQPQTGPYPQGPHVRPPYSQSGAPMGPRGYMGPGQRHPYPGQPGMHPNQQQHLQQRLQAFRHEAQQLQAQLQRVQQEESESTEQQPPDQPPRSDQIRGRLMEVDRNIRQIMSQLHNAQHHVQPGMPDGGPPMTQLQAPPGFSPHDAGSPGKMGEDPMTPGGKKKRPRKPKVPKGSKGEGEGKKVKAPPKKKKKKDTDDGSDGGPGEKKKKKKSKKSDKERSAVVSEGGESGDETSGDSMTNDVRDETFIPDPDESSQSHLIEIENSKKIKSSANRKRKPPATLVKPKKKRKRGYDSGDEMNATDAVHTTTPPASPDESLIERRSGRNVKRKRYTETMDLAFSGDDEDAIIPEVTEKKHQLVEMNDVPEDEEIMIVDKILCHRIRKKRVKRKSESHEEHPEEPVVVTDTDGEAVKTGPMLSPTSLKNPRIRKLSMGAQEEEEEEEVEGVGETEFFLKYKNYSYLHCEWKLKEEVDDKRFDQKLKRYIAKNTNIVGELVYPEVEDDEIFNPDFVEVDRVLDVMVNEDKETGKVTRHFLIKWCSLAYEDSTWEEEEDIDKNKIFEFESRCKFRPPVKKMSRPHKDMWKRLSEDNTVFQNNNRLRDYQFEGINWLLFNWYNKRNCILADEMGLGKTIQSITFLQKIFDHGIRGPFLVVAPLSTIANWQREFESWTTINAVVYHGSQTSRDMLHTYEWFCRDENLDEIPGCYKVHAVITTYEMIVLDTPHLRDVDWRCLIIDEAHRLKNLSCKLVESLRFMQLEHKVLLTGTPLQNNVEELFALLSFLQPETFNCQQAFSLEFGNLKNNTQVEKLQELLKPMMLRRLKEDVEKSLAPKQETIIEVELTSIQKKYYRAILERNFEFLAKGTTGGNVPNLMNTMMELRKCCNHPYLIKGAEDKIMQEHRVMSNEQNPLQAMIQSSGKLVLIDKLLPRLKQGGHKVLIFSQMVRVLDILEDYLVQRSYFYERIDGCIRGNERQMAIDRFSRKGSDRFVFLLCTRAGGLGINLTAADTVIIFDSDWNPQNDLQAQARCHRIGQQKPVKIYRLITRNSYEREMFDKASLKLGLDKAVLQSISGRQDQITSQTTAPQLSKTEVEDLLKRGAYGAIMDDDDAASKFCEEDIDQILDRRAHTVTLESGEKGSTFSKASFVSNVDQSDISLDDPNFWEKWAKKADLDLQQLKDNKLILEIPRHRKQTRRFGGNSDDAEIFAEIGSESEDSEYESGDERSEGRSKKSKFRSRAGGAGGGQRKGWGRRDCFRIEKCLLTYGWGRWSAIQTRGRFSGMISHEELEELSRIVLMYCLKYYNGDEKIKFFMWDLITPSEVALTTGIDLRNHEGLSAPVPRGRKGKRAKEESNSGRHKDEQMKREWASELDLEMLLPDEGFRKHLQHQCNKVLLRVRMLYYLRTEIIGNLITAIDEGVKPEALDLEIIDRIQDPPTVWWDHECDKSLLIGIYKHGYEKYSLIRADSSLCFLERVGPPDERALAAEANFEPEDTDGDPEYKPARLTFPEIDFDDSPAPGTPNTEPASPASNVDPKSKKDEDQKDEDAVVDEIKRKTALEAAASSGGMEWPTVSELNTRLRRIVTLYQKQHKHMQQRLMNIERRCGRPRYQDNRDSRRPVLQTRWTRREEADFYRTVSTFGIEREPRSGEFLWRRFRNIARLDRKTDESLRSYYIAFRNMCEQVCRWKEEPGTSDGTNIGLNEEIPNIDVDPITEERASRTLYRIRLLDKIRTEVLPHPKLKERLALCQRSPELPIWWRSGVHDHELLVAMDRHGVTRTEIHTLNDASLSFLNSMREYESNPTAFKQQILAEEKAELENLMKIMKKEEEEKAAILKAEEEVKASEQPPDAPESKDVKVEEKKVKQEKDEEMEVDPGVAKDGEEGNKEEKVVKDVEKDGEDKKVEKVGEDVAPPPVENDDKINEDPEKSSEDMDVSKPTEEVAEDPPVEVAPKKDEVREDKKEEDAIKEKDDPQSAPESSLKEDVPEDQHPVKDVAVAPEDQKDEEESSVAPKEDAEQLDVGKEEAMSPSDKEVADISSKDQKPEETEEKKDDEVTKQEDVKTDEILPEEKQSPDEGKEKTLVKETEKDKKELDLTPVQMSLRSKNSNPMSQDLFNAINSSYGGFLMSSMMSQSTSGRWPKDRVLIQRVEQVCYCIMNGEWPSPSHTFPCALPGQSGSFMGPGTPSSHPSTPLSDGRITPLSSGALSSNQNTITATTDYLAASEKQLQAAMAQIMAAGAAEPPMRSSSSRRGRRRRRPDPPQSSLAAGLSFPAQSLPPMDKALQRKIEQLMAASNPGLSFASSSTTQQNPLFATQSGKYSSGSSKSTSSSKEEELGNSSASLLANLREMAKSESKESSSRGRPRSNSGYRHLSSSPSQSRSKESSSSKQSDAMKMFLPTPEQLMSGANNPIQQVMQDAMKAGVDPMTAAAAFLPLFPMLDPFQMMNKPEHSALPMLPPNEMEKLLKSMGLPPELALMQGFLPGAMLPPVSSGKSKDQDPPEPKPSSSSDAGKSREKESSEKSIANMLGEKRTTPQRRGGSKLDAMFGGGKMEEDSPGKSSGKKARKSKFVSPAMLPRDTRIPVHNNTEGVRLSGEEAPLNEDLADWLKDNSGFVVDYQALRQQLDESSGKKTDSSETLLEMSGQESDPMISPKPPTSPKSRENPSKSHEMLAEADKLLKDAEKLALSATRNQIESNADEMRFTKTPEKHRSSSDFALPTTTAPVSSGRSSASSSMKQQLSDLALLQQMNSGALGVDPTNPLFSLPPEVLNNLANLPPDIAALLAGGLLPPGVTPEMLMGVKPQGSPRVTEEKHSSDQASPSRSSTPSRASPSQRHSRPRSRPNNPDKGPPSDPSQLTGEERVTVVNLTSGKKLSGRHAPELQTLADYLRVYPDVVVSPDWSNIIRKSKFLPKELHTRLLPSQSPTSKSSSSSSHSVSSASSNATASAAALAGLPPGAANMFPGLMQAQGMMMPDPMQLMAALQGQGQMNDLKALTAAGFPMLPFFGGMPNPLLGGGFPGQDPATVAAMAALSQGHNPTPSSSSSSSSKKETRVSSHERDGSRGRKSKKHNERGSSGNRSSSSSTKQSSSSSYNDPMAEALAALQRGGGGFPGIANPFLAGAGGNPMLFPHMMMGSQNQGLNNLLGLPMDIMNPELFAAQMAAFGAMPGLDGNAKPPTSSTTSGSSGQSKSEGKEQRKGSTSTSGSSSSKHKDNQGGGHRSQSRGADEQPMDLTQFGGGATKDRQSPDKHKH
uniref:chromodomain-helicase-DNA-binding protein 7 isoform X2 n=1 Tax=Ciona intestinalis TaxID=7719 RepID=UPI00089DCF5C|nr:chromodomain-helicase-DNA-binding protein 7 isoform X2 [Ciona intestinalis]|eukprot:XP_018669889.1 chromodomain-helicase-DNA-binding protein 7 isoform X2 [Ciona intestinalis]